MSHDYTGEQPAEDRRHLLQKVRRLAELESEIGRLQREKEEAICQGDFEKAASCRDGIERLKREKADRMGQCRS
jgi:ATP-dependent Clp protease ATP-binding subunit ClpC